MHNVLSQKYLSAYIKIIWLFNHWNMYLRVKVLRENYYKRFLGNYVD